MSHGRVFLAVVLLSGWSAAASAQTGLGGLRGVIVDAQGGALPGVTVTATAPEMLGPQTGVTNESGEYRLINLPPGTFTLTAELTGFRDVRREGILIRTGDTFQVDIAMQVVHAAGDRHGHRDSPMIEVDKASNVLNIDGEFQRLMPIQARRNCSDFLELTPGVISRGFDDGSGRQVYFGHATEHFAHVLQLEGTIATNYHDAQLTYVSMGADMVADTQVKTGGVDAASPMGTGLVMNIITKSGGNMFKGSGAFAYQPYDWNGNNVDNCSSAPGCRPGSGGTPTTAYVRQFDVALGGPLMRDKVWFFGALRRALSSSGISRTSAEVARIEAYPGSRPLRQRLGELAAVRQGHQQVRQPRRAGLLPARSPAAQRRPRVQLRADLVQSTGGPLYSGKVTSVWGSSVTTTFTALVQRQGRLGCRDLRDARADRAANHHPQQRHAVGRHAAGHRPHPGGRQPPVVQPSAGIADHRARRSHLLQGRLVREPRVPDRLLLRPAQHLQPGHPVRERRLRARGAQAASTSTTSPAARCRSAAATRPRSTCGRGRPRIATLPSTSRTRGGRTRGCRSTSASAPTSSSAATAVRHHPAGQHRDRPALRLLLQLTSDARTVLRGSAVRVHEQVMGRDAITLFGANEAAADVNIYDLNGNGVFEASETVVTPARAASIADYEFADDLHQPYVDEFILGLRRQFPWQLSVDVAGIYRSYQDNWARVDINGIYPSGPNQPFGGFGAVDPNRGIIFQQQNNSWSTLEYRALEITVAKNMSHNFQLMAGVNRQWQHFGGTWNPTDPARFIQPDAFESDTLLYMPRGNNEENSLPIATGTTVHTYGPTWQEYSMRFGGTYMAPWGIVLAGSYTVLAGPWSGPIVDQLPEGDPHWRCSGRPTWCSPTAPRRATRCRRGCASCSRPAARARCRRRPIKTLGLTVNKTINFGGSREVVLGVAIFNVLNDGNYSQYNYNGANERFNTANYLQLRNQQAARAAQFTVLARF